MDQTRIDLHTHTTCSDGSLTPLELLDLAKKSNLAGLSITDHDTIHAYPEILVRAKELALEMITGVELSADYDEETIHILGYAFDPKSKALLDACSRLRQFRLERNRMILEKLSSKGMRIDESDIQNGSHPTFTYGRVHIALALVQKGYAKNIMEAFSRYIGNGKPFYVPGAKVPVHEVIEIIHEAKGKAVLAHPHIIESNRIKNKVLELPFDGIEAYYSRFQMAQNQVWIDTAKKRGWFTTGGSDFHGSVKPDIILGCSHTPPEVFHMLKEHFYGVYTP